MRRGEWRRVIAGIGVLAASVAPSVAWAQPKKSGDDFRYSIEGYLAEYSIDDKLGNDRSSHGGFGARVLINRPDPDRAEPHSVVDRAVGGFFATFTPNQGTPSLNTLHVGFETDVPFLLRPAAGHFDPFFGVGIGVFRTSRPNLLAGGTKRINRSDLAFTPAVGTRIPFFNGIGARGDLRMPIVFGLSTTANFVAEGGLYVSF